MPTRLIKDENGMCTGADFGGDLVEVQLHDSARRWRGISRPSPVRRITRSRSHDRKEGLFRMLCVNSSASIRFCGLVLYVQASDPMRRGTPALQLLESRRCRVLLNRMRRRIDFAINQKIAVVGY
jgi:hypothetical protein